MQVDLPAALAAFVRDLVARGRYADEGDVVRDALRRLADQDLDAETGVSVSALRAELAAAEAGPHSESGALDVFERSAEKARAAAK